MANKKDNTNIGKGVSQFAEGGLVSEYKPAETQPRVPETQVPSRVSGVADLRGRAVGTTLGGYTVIGADFFSTVTNTNPFGANGVAATIHGEGKDSGTPTLYINNPRDSLSLYILDNGVGSSVLAGISTYDLVTPQYLALEYNPDGVSAYVVANTTNLDISSSTFSVDVSGTATIDGAGDVNILASGSGADVEINADDNIDIIASDSIFLEAYGARLRAYSAGALEANKTWSVYSTRKIKDNITPVIDSLARINRLRPIRFTYKENGTPAHGLIAEEVQEIEPELSDGTTVKYTEIIPLLVGAVQELTKRIEVLESRLGEV